MIEHMSDVTREMALFAAAELDAFAAFYELLPEVLESTAAAASDEEEPVSAGMLTAQITMAVQVARRLRGRAGQLRDLHGGGVDDGRVGGVDAGGDGGQSG